MNIVNVDAAQESQPVAAISETPPVAREIIDNAMSPFCPGLSLTACPSPSADSLRRAIVARVRAGESKDAILNRLYTDFGTAIRGAPDATGLGLVFWVAPGFVVITGAIFLTLWLRRQAARTRSRARPDSVQQGPAHALNIEAHSYAISERHRLEELLKHDR